ncbi:transposase [Microbacterium lacticum]
MLVALTEDLTNARTEGFNRIIKQTKRVGCGFTNMDNYRRRIMVHIVPERKADVYAAWVQLVNALIVIKKIVTEGWYRYRWDGRPKKWKRAWGRSTARRIARLSRSPE